MRTDKFAVGDEVTFTHTDFWERDKQVKYYGNGPFIVEYVHDMHEARAAGHTQHVFLRGVDLFSGAWLRRIDGT